MAIDWMNPSDDVLEAKRVGYHEALDAFERTHEAVLEEERKEILARLESAYEAANRGDGTIRIEDARKAVG